MFLTLILLSLLVFYPRFNSGREQTCEQAGEGNTGLLRKLGFLGPTRTLIVKCYPSTVYCAKDCEWSVSCGNLVKRGRWKETSAGRRGRTARKLSRNASSRQRGTKDDGSVLYSIVGIRNRKGGSNGFELRCCLIPSKAVKRCQWLKWKPFNEEVTRVDLEELKVEAFGKAAKRASAAIRDLRFYTATTRPQKFFKLEICLTKTHPTPPVCYDRKRKEDGGMVVLLLLSSLGTSLGTGLGVGLGTGLGVPAIGEGLKALALRNEFLAFLARFPPELWPFLTPELMAKLTPAMIAQLTSPEMLAQLTRPDLLAAVTPEILAAVSSEQLAAVTPELLSLVTPEMIELATPEVIAQLTPELLAELAAELAGGGLGIGFPPPPPPPSPGCVLSTLPLNAACDATKNECDKRHNGVIVPWTYSLPYNEPLLTTCPRITLAQITALTGLTDFGASIALSFLVADTAYHSCNNGVWSCDSGIICDYC